MSLPVLSYGTGTTTGAAITIACGFKPAFVVWLAEGGQAIGLHINGMADAEALIVSDNADGTADIGMVTSAGITLSASGFSVGTDADLNTNNEAYSWVAFKGA